jgi:hypothetical protein
MILLKRGSTIHDLTLRLRQNLGAKTFVLIRVDLTLKTTPPPIFLDPIPLVGSDHFLYYIYFAYSNNKLLRNSVATTLLVIILVA